MSNEVSQTLPSSPEDRDRVKKALKEACALLDIIDSSKDSLKDLIKTVKDRKGKIRMPAKVFNMRVKAMRENSKVNQEVLERQEALDDLTQLNMKV